MQKKIMFKEQKQDYQDVTAIVTAMTDGEQPFLKETVKAVLSDPDIGQVILCIEKNNAWIDNTLGSLRNDPRLELVWLSLATPPIIRNQALKHVRLPWIAYCDGDDVWCQGKTARQRAYADATESDFIGADHFLTDEAGKIRAVAQARYIPMPSSWIVRTEIMRQYPFDESVQVGSDGEWWTRTSNKFKRVRYPELVVKYRVRSGSISSNTPSKRRKAKIINIASTPILGSTIFILTWCSWRLTRCDHYLWLKTWTNANPLQDLQNSLKP